MLFHPCQEREGKDRAYGWCAQAFAGMDVDYIRATCKENFEKRVKKDVYEEMKQLVSTLIDRGWNVSRTG